MANQLNGSGITLDSLAPTDIETGGTGKVLLYASGSGANSRLYVKAGGDTQTLLGIDIDVLDALGDASIAQGDHLLLSDAGTEKKVTFSNLEDSIFANVSDGATIAAGGALTIGASTISGTMIVNDAVDGNKIADDAVNSEHIALGALDAEHYSSGSIENGHLAGSIANAKLANSSVTLTAGAGMASLGSVSLGSSVTVAVDGVLEDLDSLGAAGSDGQFIVATGEGAFAYESGATVRTSLGLGTGDSPQFTGLTLTGTGSVGGDLSIAGNLTVNGTTTTVNSTAVEIGDRIIELNTAGAAGDAGLYVQDVNSSNTGSLLWDTSANRWFAGVKGSEVNLVTISSTDTLTNKTLTSPDINTPDIDGGTIDGATIATSDITVGSGKTLDVSGGTLTLANDQIAAAKVTGLDGAGLADSSGVLSVNVDDSTIEINSDSLRVKADGIDSSHIALGALDAEHYSSGSIETGHLASRAVTNAKIANDAVDSAQIADDAVNSEHIALGALDAEHYSSGSIENGHLANSSITVSDGSNSTARSLGQTLTITGSANEVDVAESSGTVTIGLPASVAVTTAFSVASNAVSMNSSAFVVGGGYGSTGLTVDMSGNLTMDGNLSVGVDGTSSDASFYGASSGDGLFWDGSNNRLGLNKSADTGYAIDVKQGDGDVRADAFVTYSDRELKYNIVAIDDSLDKIMKLDAVSYDMKSSGRHEIGFIAQEVAKVVPEICALDSNGVGRGIDYGRLTSLLAGAVKTQQNQIAELKAAIAKLDK